MSVTSNAGALKNQLSPLSKHVLITGGAGFIGRHLARALSERGCEVHALGRAELDVGSREKVLEVFACLRPEWVFHLAADTRQEVGADLEKEMTLTNVEGTRAVLDAAAIFGVAACVVAGSVSEYGSASQPFREDGELRPMNAYGKTKVAASALVAKYGHATVPAVTLRFSNVYGSGMLPQAFIPTVVRAARGEGLVTASEGLIRDFVHVDDIVAACILAAEKIEICRGEAINVTCGIGVSTRAVVHIAEHIQGLSENTLVDTREFIAHAGQQMSNVASNEKAKSLLGWAPRITLEEGLRSLLS